MVKKNNLLQVGKPAPESRLYVCTKCGNVAAMLKDEIAGHCEVCGLEKHAWRMTQQEVMLKTKNVAREIAKHKTWSDRVADVITHFCGSVEFVYIHILWFGLWIVLNLGWFGMQFVFDPFPYGLLTLVVSLEAIFLATFILMSQNRDAEIANLRSELDFQTNLKSEKDIEEILALQRKMFARMKKR